MGFLPKFLISQLCLFSYVAGTSVPALAQSTAPSSVIPETLRPEANGQTPQIIRPETSAISPPSGAEGLRVTLSSVDVEGGYAELADQIAIVTNRLINTSVSLEQIYAAASEIEAIHARAGYVLVRAAIPPQSLAGGGVLKIIIVDGFIEGVDVTALPNRARKSVLARTAPLIRKGHIGLKQLERPVLIAGETPGLSMTSSLVRGAENGGARLVLAGTQKLISGNIGAENSLAPSLGRHIINAQLSINSPSGYGEQIYAFAATGYDITKIFEDDNPVRVLGGGILFPLRDARLSINPEVTFARTQPLPQINIPQTRGNLTRLTLRASYLLIKSRSSQLAVDAALEHLEQSNDAPMFNVRLSEDRFMVARLGFRYNNRAERGTQMVISGQISQGVSSKDVATDQPTDIGFSRQGSDPAFTKLNLSFRSASSIAKNWQMNFIAKGQTSFGDAVFRSEQSALEGSDALSAFVGDVTAVDESATVRVELARPFNVNLPGKPQLAPYAFAAAGYGRINNPTALEREDTHAAALGAGLRITVPNIGIGGLGLVMGLEYAHGRSNLVTNKQADRLSAAMSFRF